MTKANRWLLPDGVDEILPPRANKLETLRREILDLYRSWGYELVITPLIEFLDSLMIIPSEELHLQTFKVVDQLSGRTMGVRADITSQVARIDAHVLQSKGPARLCYAGSTLMTKPGSMLSSRSPIKIGAELYGHSGSSSDLEVISLMLETLRCAGIANVQLALGHVGIYHSLVENLDLDEDLEQKIFTAIQRKSPKDLADLLMPIKSHPELLRMLTALPGLCGDITVLDDAEEALYKAPGSVAENIHQLRELSRQIQASYPEQSLYFDLSELRGYEYHTGVVFGAYCKGHGQSIAKGGRYDNIGAGFGRARAATGFDCDLKTLLVLSSRDFGSAEKIFAPLTDDPALHEMIRELRQQGSQVICELDRQAVTAAELGCTHEIALRDGKWQLQPLATSV
jgi:ATP phosphoribosyltransferase regulatory subunit